MEKCLVLALVLLSASASAGVPNTSVLVGDETIQVSPRATRYAVEVTGSPTAFGGKGLAPGYPDAQTIGASVLLDFQPTFMQKYGTLGFGPVFTAYPISARQGVTEGFFSIWSFGAEVRYQLHYFDNQILVPSIGYEFERMHYAFTTGQQGWLNLTGPMAGLALLLNSLDSRSAYSLYKETGISRSYLVAEGRWLSGGVGDVTPSGLSSFFGLRLEF